MRAESQERSVPRSQITARKEHQDDGTVASRDKSILPSKFAQDHTICASSIAMHTKFFKNAQSLTQSTLLGELGAISYHHWTIDFIHFELSGPWMVFPERWRNKGYICSEKKPSFPRL